MGQEQTLMGKVLERRPYGPPSQEGLRAWRSPSRGTVIEGFYTSPPSDGIMSADDWEEIAPPHPWDHDHCEFCWATFMVAGASSDPSTLAEGYVTEKGQWICDQCFADFRDEFDWSVAGG